jgi:hypothetical protein
LLADAPQDIVDINLTRHATLRKGFDQNCNALVNAMLTADLTADHSLPGRFHAWLERGFAKVYFVANFMHHDKSAAAVMGVQVSLADKIGAVVAGILITAKMTLYAIAARIPVIRDAADRSLVRKLTRQLAQYGRADVTTHAAPDSPHTPKDGS